VVQERSELSRLAVEIAELLRRAGEEPSSDHKHALAYLLQSLYNCCEQILEQTAKHYGDSLPEGGDSHSGLLSALAQKTEGRPALLSPNTRDGLKRIMALRHALRHQYAFLRWDLMRAEAVLVPDVLAALDADLAAFEARMRNLGGGA
jgi:hypothetical protein